VGLVQQGLVVKVKEDHCIVVTRDGAFKRAPLPPGGARVGVEITYRAPVLAFHSRPLMIAASFLILILGLAMFRNIMPPAEALAYVSLDIYPNLELAVDRNLKVVDVKFLDDGETDIAALIKPDELKQEDLYQAVQDVIERAVAGEIIKPGQGSLIVSTVTVTGPRAASIDPAKLKQSLETASASVARPEEVKVYTVTGELRAAAQANGLSSGRYIVYKQLQQAGQAVTVDEVQRGDLQQLVTSRNVNLLPDSKKLGVKKQGNSKEPDLYVENNDKPASTKPGKSSQATPGKPTTVVPGWSWSDTPSRPTAVTPDWPTTTTPGWSTAPGWPNTFTPGWPATVTPGKSQDRQDKQDDDRGSQDGKGQNRDSDDKDEDKDDKDGKGQNRDQGWSYWNGGYFNWGTLKQPATGDDKDDDDGRGKDGKDSEDNKDKEQSKEQGWSFWKGGFVNWGTLKQPATGDDKDDDDGSKDRKSDNDKEDGADDKKDTGRKKQRTSSSPSRSVWTAKDQKTP
jgi:hypothetical protein